MDTNGGTSHFTDARRGRRRWMLIVVAALLALISIRGFMVSRQIGHASEVNALHQTLVVVVPGTFGNDGFWPNVLDGKTTFGSEMQKTAGEGAVVYPFLWNGANSDAGREAAASSLASLIDQKASGFDRICIVGHSHGGNIALLAAGECHTKIDLLVCLATPQAYLLMRGPDRRNLAVPVYCTFESRRNVRALIGISAIDDKVQTEWAGVFSGLTVQSATSLTRSWQEHLEFPRLASDGPLAHLFTKSELVVEPKLSVADDNIDYSSNVTNPIARHSCAHCMQMGRFIGAIIREHASPNSLEAIRSYIQPNHEDSGEPGT